MNVNGTLAVHYEFNAFVKKVHSPGSPGYRDTQSALLRDRAVAERQPMTVKDCKCSRHIAHSDLLHGERYMV